MEHVSLDPEGPQYPSTVDHDIPSETLGSEGFLNCLPCILSTLVKVKERLSPEIGGYMLMTATASLFMNIFGVSPCVS